MKKNILQIAFLCTTMALSQSKTLVLDDNQNSPNAKISDISWIQGIWRGEAFGGITEEIWSPLLAGSIMGSFRVIKNGKVIFYEFETITETEQTLILKLKHFNSDLVGWEDKETTIDFNLVKVTDNMVYFDGFTFERINETKMNTYVIIDGHETKFSFQKLNH